MVNAPQERDVDCNKEWIVGVAIIMQNYWCKHIQILSKRGEKYLKFFPRFIFLLFPFFLLLLLSFLLFFFFLFTLFLFLL